MDELESQIAKIQLGNLRSASSFVYVMAEKAQGSDAELFAVTELPLLNPAALASCEQISQSIAGTLKRAYRRPLSSINFELAISQVNEELSKLASLGQTHWINQLSGILAVKIGHELNISTVGKVSAYILRKGEYTDISCSAERTHPLKAFENYASGKIRLDDLIILSTNQLFNYLSMDRLKQVLSQGHFLKATQTIIELLKETAGPEVAFGTLLNLQVPAGQTAEEEVDLENYAVEKPGGASALWTKALNLVTGVISPVSQEKRKPAVSLPKVALDQNVGSFREKVKRAASSGRGWALAAKNLILNFAKYFNPRDFRQYSREKKFFFIAAGVLLVTFVIVLFLTAHYKSAANREAKLTVQIKDALSLASQAESALFYNNSVQAADLLAQAQTKLPHQSELTKKTLASFEAANKQLGELRNKLEKTASAQVEVIGNLGQASALIKLPQVLATQSGGNIVSYDKATGQFKDGSLKNKAAIANSVYAAKNQAVIYTGTDLAVWDYATGQNGAAFGSSVPGQNNAAGLAFYPTNSRVYMVDRQNSQITSFLVGNGTLSRPIAAVKDQSLSGAVDLAVDGSIYVLTGTGIVKFQAGKLAEFSIPTLAKPLSGQGKIFTDRDAKNIYVLDSGNNRIVIFDKKGAVVNTLTSESFSSLKDFQVDEKNKTIYVLNDSTLLKVNIP